MVKTYAPFMSLTASGRFGECIQYAETRRVTVAGRRRHPKQPRTRKQLATRLYMSLLARAWSTNSDADHATWDNHPTRDRLSRYHAYLKHNANRYKNLPGRATGMAELDVYPSTRYPTSIDTAPGFTTGHSFDQTPGTLTHHFTVTATNDNWIYIYHLNVNSGPLPTYADIVQAVVVQTTGSYTVRMTGLDAGDSRLRIFRISRSGKTFDTPTTFFFTIT